MRELTVTSADGTPLAARSAGEGPPLVLVHGVTGGIDAFATVEPALREHHTVWVYDRRGRGGSGDTQPYAFEREVDDLVAVLAAAGPEAHVVAHSFGAAVALDAARRGLALATLSLYEPPLHLDRADPVHLATAAEAVAADDLDRALAAFFDIAGVRPSEAALLRSLPPVWAALRDGVRVAPRELDALRRLSRAAPGHPPIRAPVTLLTGSDTHRPVYATADGLRSSIPQLEERILTGQGHLGFAFDPGQFVATILAFTTRHGSVGEAAWTEA